MIPRISEGIGALVALSAALAWPGVATPAAPGAVRPALGGAAWNAATAPPAGRAPSPARDSDAFHSPSAGATLMAGSSLEVRWAAAVEDFALEPGEADEAELVLSLDGGDTFQVRVSAELSPRAESYRWRVPALPTSRARLALRFGSRGAEQRERIVLVGPEFAIESDASEPDRLVRGTAEWWTEQALTERSAEDLLGTSVEDARERLVAVSMETEADRPGPALSLVAPASDASVRPPVPVRRAPASRLAPPPAFAPRPLRL